jgi:very-short-patch-repair endonuclease/DNA-directed RNA polymerase subunit RPC12/RpoP
MAASTSVDAMSRPLVSATMTTWKEPTQLPTGAESRSANMTAADKVAAAALRRRRPSSAEALLWEELRDCRLEGFRFVREKEILGWFADFYCAAGRLVVEVDGREHRERRVEDNRRDEVMRAERYRVLRIPAVQVFRDLDGAVSRITLALDHDWVRSRRDRLISRSRGRLDHKSAHIPDSRQPVPARPAGRPSRAGRPFLRRLYCDRCRQQFTHDVSPGVGIECRRCLKSDQIKAVCIRCNKPVPKVVSLEGWRCKTCEDAHSVAVRAAAAGETPSGPLHLQRSRASRVR